MIFDEINQKNNNKNRGLMNKKRILFDYVFGTGCKKYPEHHKLKGF